MYEFPFPLGISPTYDFTLQNLQNLMSPIPIGYLVDERWRLCQEHYEETFPFPFVANDVVVVIALPDNLSGEFVEFVTLFCHCRFERANDCAQ